MKCRQCGRDTDFRPPRPQVAGAGIVIDASTTHADLEQWAWYCPSCGGTEHSYLTTRRLWKCKACKKQTSVKAGTVFQDSPIPLTK